MTAPLAGCGKSRRSHKAAWVREPAAGRPATCPDGAVDPFGDGTPGPMDARCSYADAYGGAAVQVRGSVSGEAEGGGLPVGLADMVVELRAQPKPQAEGARKPKAPTAAARGPLATGRTDAQGAFSMSAVVRPGRYRLLVRAQPGGAVLATSTVEIASAGTTDKVRILVPVDPALR